jgi:hypothetical protein
MAPRRYRCSWDDIAALDADFVASWGAFEPGRLETVEFDGDHLPTKTLVFEMQDQGDHFRAFYEWKLDDDEPTTVRSEVRVEKYPCRFGGHRTYFICPCCDRRVLRLAVLDSGLACARCGRVTWKSRREQPLARVIRKANKVGNKLGCDEWWDVPKARPKHMRLKTYELLRGRRLLLTGQINNRLAARLVRNTRLLYEALERS